MSLHDEYARLTPFEIAFPGDSAFPELLANIRTEATERGLDHSNFQEFMSLTNVGEALKTSHQKTNLRELFIVTAGCSSMA